MEKETLVRFGLSFPSALIEQFNRYTKEQGYTNRSEAMRDMARKAILESSHLNPKAHIADTIVAFGK